MKSVLLIRHAKSSWNFDVDDFERPLNDRGRKNAPEMAKRLLNKNIKIDAFISSPANRAFSTAKLFADEFGVKSKKIMTVPALYHAAAETFYSVIEEADTEDDHLAIFSHNPAITEFANLLTATSIDDMPTCGIFAVKAPIKKWKEFRDAQKEFWFFDYPKAL